MAQSLSLLDATASFFVSSHLLSPLPLAVAADALGTRPFLVNEVEIHV